MNNGTGKLTWPGRSRPTPSPDHVAMVAATQASWAAARNW
jgi:hypothetical protein